MREVATERRIEIVMAVGLGVLAVLLATSLAASYGWLGRMQSGFVAVPGRAIETMLHVLSWWVPIYFALLALVCARDAPFTWSGVVLINLIHLPILTGGTLLRLLDPSPRGAAPVVTVLRNAFTTQGAVIVVGLLLAVESLLILQVRRWMESRFNEEGDDEEPSDDEGLTWRRRPDSVERESWRSSLVPSSRAVGSIEWEVAVEESADDIPAAMEDDPLMARDGQLSRDEDETLTHPPLSETLRALKERLAVVDDTTRALEDARRTQPEEEINDPVIMVEEASSTADPENVPVEEDLLPLSANDEPPLSEDDDYRFESADWDDDSDDESPLPLIFGHTSPSHQVEDAEVYPSSERHEGLMPQSPGEDVSGDGAPDEKPIDEEPARARPAEESVAWDEIDAWHGEEERGAFTPEDRSDDGWDDMPSEDEPWLETDEQEGDGSDSRDQQDDETNTREHSAPLAPSLARHQPRYELPIEGVLHQYADNDYAEIDDRTRDAGEVLRVTLEEFGIKAEVTGIRKGPVVTMFEILPAPGVKLAKITNLSDNIALRLAAKSVRIVAPIPGKHAVGIEIPNKERHLVSFAELLVGTPFFESSAAIPIALGKDITGNAQIVDLSKTPHLLIAGATGSGKSVCVNSIICSVLYRRSYNEVKLILIDPKIVELKLYNDIPHLLTPVITDPKRAFQALQYLIYEMERRYMLLDSLGTRDITSYNARIRRRNLATEPLPYIVVIIDEFADLMVTSGKELESTVARLAAMSRAVGIHLVLATQRPSTDVITGLIKANIPSRVAFMVASKIDSRIILDGQGAEKLLGRGDMLYTSSDNPFPVRMQGTFLTDEEVERVVEHVKSYGEPEYIDDEIFVDEDDDDETRDTLEDPLMERAIEIVNSSKKASASYLQRRLKIGYNRAARMVEEMERMGIVGPQNGSKPREVLGVGAP